MDELPGVKKTIQYLLDTFIPKDLINIIQSYCKLDINIQLSEPFHVCPSHLIRSELKSILKKNFTFQTPPLIYCQPLKNAYIPPNRNKDIFFIPEQHGLFIEFLQILDVKIEQLARQVYNDNNAKYVSIYHKAKHGKGGFIKINIPSSDDIPEYKSKKIGTHLSNVTLTLTLTSIRYLEPITGSKILVPVVDLLEYTMVRPEIDMSFLDFCVLNNK